MHFRHQLVECIPTQLDGQTLYVTLEHNTCIHLCACGCGEEVVTPLSPSDWKLTYNGTGITLYPSIGNWIFNCRSHYWIREGRIVWANSWSDDKVRDEHEKMLAEKQATYRKPLTWYRKTWDYFKKVFTNHSL